MWRNSPLQALPLDLLPSVEQWFAAHSPEKPAVILFIWFLWQTPSFCLLTQVDCIKHVKHFLNILQIVAEVTTVGFFSPSIEQPFLLALSSEGPQLSERPVASESPAEGGFLPAGRGPLPVIFQLFPQLQSTAARLSLWDAYCRHTWHGHDKEGCLESPLFASFNI